MAEIWLFLTDCPIPNDIPNANKLYNGLTNGSIAMYACMPGYASNSYDSVIHCVSGIWSPSDMNCSGKRFRLFCLRCTCNTQVKYHVNMVVKNAIDNVQMVLPFIKVVCCGRVLMNSVVGRRERITTTRLPHFFCKATATVNEHEP